MNGFYLTKKGELTMFVQESAPARIFEQLQSVVQEYLGDAEELKPDTALEDELAIDSIELIDLGIKLEKAFGITLPIVEVRRCTTIADLDDLILRVLAEKASV